MGESDASSRGGSERGGAPKISIMRLGDDMGVSGAIGARTTHDSRSIVSLSNEEDDAGAKAAISISSLDDASSSRQSDPVKIRVMAMTVEGTDSDSEEEKKETSVAA